MNIGGLLKTTTIDFPGKIACVVFTVGCNYNCNFCHNRQLLENPALLSQELVVQFLKKRVNMLEGVVISGGEPTLQKDLISFIKRLKMLGYAVKLDTNGSNPFVIKKLVSSMLVDYVAVDYKAPFYKYTNICEHDATGVFATLDVLLNSKISWEMRTTVIPELDADTLAEMAKAIPPLPCYALQLYRPVYNDPRNFITPVGLEEVAQRIRKFQPNTIVRC